MPFLRPACTDRPAPRGDAIRRLIPLVLLGLAWAGAEGVSGGEFEDLRAALVREHDRNGDGRLDPGEREALRQATARGRLVPAPSPRLPQDFLDKYDRDKDGDMAPAEWKEAWDAETRILIAGHDADGDGQLNEGEKAALMRSVREGRVTGVAAFFAGRLAGQGEGSAEFRARSKAWLEADADRDGRADAGELEALRRRRADQDGAREAKP